MMRKKFLPVLFCLFAFSYHTFSQGTIRGKIIDNSGEALIGATVVLKSNKAVGVAADLDGNYSLKITDTSAQTIVVSYVGYTNQEAIVHPKNGEVIIKDFALSSSAVLEEVVVTAKEVKGNNYYMEKMKMNSSTSISYISQETMRKTGDVSVVNAVARVSGVSSSSSAGYVTVRGLGDRYVVTTINGLRIPTLDPYTNNIRLDLFPASLVDNIILSKTASPDVPGNWAGAYMSIETKDFPDKLTVNIETAFGYNPQSTFKDILSSTHSSTDWLGYDNSLRPHANNSNGGSPSPVTDPSNYQVFSALGYGPYFNSIGVTSSTPWNSTYFNLGLVQMGLLQNSQLGDPNAIAAATTQFNNGPYKGQAYTTLNTPVSKLGQSFPDDWDNFKRKGVPNMMQSFSIGNQVNLFGRPLGLLAGFRYGNTIQYDPNSVSNRVNSDRSFEQMNSQQQTIESNTWSALVNLSYKYSKNHSIGLLFMPNFTGVNQVRNMLDSRDPSEYHVSESAFYEHRQQLIYQLKSEHYIPSIQLKVEGNASYTQGKSDAPDYRDVTFYKQDNNTHYTVGPQVGNGAQRYYRYLKDNMFDSRLSAEMPIGDAALAGGPRKIKVGGSYQYDTQKRDNYDYQVILGRSNTVPPMTSDNVDSYFALSNFAITNNSLNMWYVENGTPANHTFGYSSLAAGYIMTDYSIIKRLRVSGGLRVEKANIFTDVFKYDSLHYTKDDPRRTYQVGFPLVNPGNVNMISYLPSAGLIYKIKSDEKAPINVRLNYGQTVGRPSIRELSDVVIYDFNYRYNVIGNSNLKPMFINNYDAKLEWYFKNTDNVSAGIFYKDVKDAIEFVNSTGYLTWQNADKSYAYGIELEGKKTITKSFDFMANVTLVKSNTQYTRERILTGANGYTQYIPDGHVSRQMYGQAPYIVNAIIMYNAPEKWGLNVTLSYNRQGPRIVMVSDLATKPDIYEMPRNMFDFKIIKKLGKYFGVTLTIRDILNTAIRRTYLYSDGTKVDYDKYRYGTQYVLSITYKI